jgi:hypothetical protein
MNRDFPSSKEEPQSERPSEVEMPYWLKRLALVKASPFANTPSAATRAPYRRFDGQSITSANLVTPPAVSLGAAQEILGSGVTSNSTVRWGVPRPRILAVPSSAYVAFEDPRGSISTEPSRGQKLRQLGKPGLLCQHTRVVVRLGGHLEALLRGAVTALVVLWLLGFPCSRVY